MLARSAFGVRRPDAAVEVAAGETPGPAFLTNVVSSVRNERTRTFMKLKTLIILWTILALTVQAASASSDAGTVTDGESPLWEFGLFNGYARYPHYRGSDEYTDWAFPIPYLIYRGEIFQADREGIRGIFVKTEHLETNVSFFGNPPVDPDNRAREGMPEIDALIEFGPAAKWFFSGRRDDTELFLYTALRAATSVDVDDGGGVAHEGWHGLVSLNYTNQRPFGKDNWRCGIKAGVDFTDHEYNSLFYDVAPRHATVVRKAFDSGGGYGGLFVSFSAMKRLTDRISLGSFIRWENVDGAVFDDSPLVRDKNNVIFGCALVWKLRESAELAP